MKLFISETLLKKMANGNSCMDLPDGKAFELFTVHNKKYIVVGSSSSGKDGTYWVGAYECILLEQFKGKSLSYDENCLLVNNGTKERDSGNVRFTFRGKKWVIISKKITFYPVKDETQLQLF
jgi:hypothetical protein